MLAIDLARGKKVLEEISLQWQIIHQESHMAQPVIERGRPRREADRLRYHMVIFISLLVLVFTLCIDS
jgi:hypothetical protein